MIAEQDRKYRETHPWISFRLRLKEVPHTLWMKFGEAQSKCDHIAGVPLPADVYEKLHLLYLAKGAAGTTAIEGNTLTEAQVLAQIAGSLELPASKEYMRQEVKNMLQAFQQVTDSLKKEGRLISSPVRHISVDLINSFNGAVLAALPNKDGVEPGQIRHHSVVVGNVYRGAPAEDCEYLLTRLCEWLSELEAELQDFPPVVVGLIKAVLAHLYIAWIHPFGDGNGRTARLIEFYLLMKAGVSTPVAHVLSNHYNLTRTEYARQLDLANKNGGDPLGFMEYAVQGFIDGLKEQLEIIRNYQWRTAWRDYVRAAFEGKEREHDKRREHLVIDLSTAGPTVMSKIPEISTRLTQAYAKLKPRTVGRDVQELIAMGLVEVKEDKVRAMSETVLFLLPFRQAEWPKDPLVEHVLSHMVEVDFPEANPTESTGNA